MPKQFINAGVEIRDAEQELQRFRYRLGILSIFILSLFCLLIIRFIYLQIFQKEHYTTLAESNRISVLPIAPHRGVIVDRNGIMLAHNYSAYTLEITPNKVEDLESTINA